MNVTQFDQIPEAEKELIAFIRKVLNLSDDVRITVESWSDQFGGYRISEIDVFTPDPERGLPFGSGGTYMQSDYDAGAVLFAAERFVISRNDPIEEWGLDSYIDYRQEREQALAEALGAEIPEWEDRR
jgi:hypothetical protein